jgi:hypothetical protein
MDCILSFFPAILHYIFPIRDGGQEDSPSGLGFNNR